MTLLRLPMSNSDQCRGQLRQISRLLQFLMSSYLGNMSGQSTVTSGSHPEAIPSYTIPVCLSFWRIKIMQIMGK